MMAPFMKDDHNGGRSVNTTRILEALIIAAIIGGINLAGTSRAFDERFLYLKEKIEKIEVALDRIQQDFYRPFRERRG